MCRVGIVIRIIVVALDEESPELEQFVLGVRLDHLLKVVERDDPGPDLGVQLLLVAAVVGGDELAYDAAVGVDVQLGEPLVENLHAALYVVLLLALQVALDGLLGL